MLKLKILNKPKILKLKCTSKFPDVVLANFQEKGVTPTEEIQVVVADKPYDGLSKVTIQPIPSEYIVPTGFREITENGSYDVSEYQVADVFVPEKILGTKTIKQNGVYNATEDNLDGYSSVDIKVEGWDTSQIRRTSNMFNGNTIMTEAPLFDTSNVTETTGMFSGCTNLEKVPQYNISNATNVASMFNNCKKLVSIPKFDTQKATHFYSFAYGCSSLKTFPELNTSLANNIQQFLYGCTSLETIPLLNCGKVTSLMNAFFSVTSLINCGGLKDIGKAYTQKSNNYGAYAVAFDQSRNLTHDSLMNIINNLYDLNLTYGVANGGTLYTQQLRLGANLNKLTAEEIAIATNKGWTVS